MVGPSHILPSLRFRTYCDLLMLQEGSESTNDRLRSKYGITHFEKVSPDHCVYTIGFNEKEQKWFGWSHRAIFGFGVGSTCEPGDCHFLPSNEKEFLEQADRWYKDDMYKNVKFTPGTNDDRKGLWVEYNIRTNKGKDLSTIKTFAPYPEKWGKGKWKAKTLEDAKQMAINFAKSVS